MNERNLSAIPEAACRLAGGELFLGDNGSGAKTAPVKLKARSGQPIEHWFWGKVVHDLAGMRTHKPRLTIDYAHDEGEVLGYLNHFDTESGDLMVSGALTPFRDDDRASEVLFKMRAGVPYEASIFFGGDGIKVQEVMEGEIAPVNGYQFEGPGVIIREWPLRGVAICPYGADANTNSTAMSSGETITAAKWTAEAQEIVMEQEPETVEAEAAVEVAETVEAPAVEAEEPEAEQEPEAAELQAEDPEAVAETPVEEPAASDGVNLSAALEESQASRAALALRAEKAEAELQAALAARDEAVALANKADEARRVAESKLAAIEKGQPPLSAESAENNEGGSLMERARRKKG